MFLSDRDIEWAIETGKLVIEPRPERIDATSVDLHLDRVEEAKIWDIDRTTLPTRPNLSENAESKSS